MHRVELTPGVARDLRRLGGSRLIALRGAILSLAEDPRPPGARTLVGAIDLWRIRVRIDGERWRVVYQVRDPERLVVITRVARRDDATYRGR